MLDKLIWRRPAGPSRVGHRIDAALWSADVTIDQNARIVTAYVSGAAPAAVEVALRTGVSAHHALGFCGRRLATAVQQAVTQGFALAGQLPATDQQAAWIQYRLRWLPSDGQWNLALDAALEPMLLLVESFRAESTLAEATCDMLASLSQDWGREGAARAVLPQLAKALSHETAALFSVHDGRGSVIAAFGPTRKRGFPYPHLELADPLLAEILMQPSLRVVSGTHTRDLPAAVGSVCSPRARSILLHSIFSGHVVRGLVVFSDRKSHPLSVEELGLLTAAADGLGLSLGSAVLRQASQASEAVLDSATAAAHGISGSLDLNETFRRIARAAAQVTGDSRCLLLELDDDSGDFVAVACSNKDDALLLGTRVQFQVESESRVLERSRRITVEDVQWGVSVSPEQRERLTLQSAVIVPLRSETGSVGALLLYSVGRRTEYSADDIVRAESIAEQAASAIWNGRLYRTLKRSEEESRRLLERITGLRSQERLAFANTVHDEVLQTLVAALYELEGLPDDLGGPGAESVQRAAELLRATILEARTIIRELRPPVLDGLGLAEAIRALANQDMTGCNVLVELENAHVDGLDLDVTTAVYTVVREALQNARHHARARTVTVKMVLESGRHEAVASPHVRLSVTDDGRGFDVAKNERDHFGLKIMDEQVRSLGGTLRIDSVPGRGTRVEALLPLQASGCPE